MAVVEASIQRWKTSGACERANYQLFLTQLCEEVLAVDPLRPARAAVEENTYVFERSVSFADGGTTGYIDLYKKDCFVLEAKQGSDRPVVTEKEEFTGERLKRKMGAAGACFPDLRSLPGDRSITPATRGPRSGGGAITTPSEVPGRPRSSS